MTEDDYLKLKEAKIISRDVQEIDDPRHPLPLHAPDGLKHKVIPPQG